MTEDQGDLFSRRPVDDITSNFHGGNSESRAANRAVASTKEAHRRLVVDTILVSGNDGKTCDEVELITGLKHQTCSARFTELKRDGILVPTGERRLTRGGRTKAAVFKVAAAEQRAVC